MPTCIHFLTSLVYEEVEPRKLWTVVDQRCTMQTPLQGRTCWPSSRRVGTLWGSAWPTESCFTQIHVLLISGDWVRQGYKGSAISTQHGATLTGNTPELSNRLAEALSGLPYSPTSPSAQPCFFPLPFSGVVPPINILHPKLHLSVGF